MKQRLMGLSKCFLLGAVVILALSASAEEPIFGKKKPRSVEWTLDSPPDKMDSGSTVILHLVGKIPAGWHTYSLKTYDRPGPSPTSISIAPEELLALAGPITATPAPKIENDSGFDNLSTELFEDAVTFNVPVKLNANVASGEHTATLLVNSQICRTDKIRGVCMPPFDVLLKFSFTVTPSTSGAAVLTVKGQFPPLMTPALPLGNVAPTVSPDDTKAMILKAKNKGLMAYLWVAFLSGGLALLTPCVFPMIPITVSFFTKRRRATRARAIRDAGIYSLGIICTFIVLGFAFALLLGASGINAFASNPWVNIGVAAVFIGLALSLFGVYEIQLPSKTITRLNITATQGDGVGSVLLMGLVFSLTSFTCTVPFVGAVMVAATQGDWLWPFLGMLVFSSVFAAPFFFLALFPAVLKSLPKSGAWLNSVKILMGFIEIAAAMKFMSNADLVWHWGVLTRPVFLGIWILLALASAAYLLGKIKFKHDTPIRRLSGYRWMNAAACLVLAVFLLRGLLGARLGKLDAFTPPQPYPGINEENWEGTLAEAKRTGKTIFVDFTGYTCTNCRDMESNMFPIPEVATLLDNYVRVKLYTDDPEKGAQYQQMQEKRFGTVALPFYVLLSPDNKTTINTFDGRTTDVDEFTQFLKSGLNRTTTAALTQNP